MLLKNILLLLLISEAVDEDSAERICSYQEVLNHLNLTEGNELFSLTRPIKDFRKPTNVSLDLLLYAILDVREIDQTFVPYVWIVLMWQNDFISWNSSLFCGIKHVTVPTDILWKPDLTIEEMTERDKAPPSPYLVIFSNGSVLIQNDQVLVSTCRMQVYKFPFDVQSCTLSFKSVVHSVDEIRLSHYLNSSVTTKSSRELMRTQYEWLFINMTVTAKRVSPLGSVQDTIIYTILMKRRSVLYIVNFLLPILFFLCLDLASFLIPDRGGEKLSFKVTVLLAVTVMQLILNDILPSSADKIPLIVVYCIGIFTLMMFSLLETILMMYLMEKEAEYQADAGDGGQGPAGSRSRGRESSVHSWEGEKKSWTSCACVCAVPADRTPSEQLQSPCSPLADRLDASDKLLVTVQELVKILTLLISSMKEEEKPDRMSRKIRIINKIYFIVYITAASCFLVVMFSTWTSEDE